MGGLKLSRAFYFWLALARYLSHMKAAMSAIQARVALRNKHYAWASWRYCVEYARIGRKVSCKDDDVLWLYLSHLCSCQLMTMPPPSHKTTFPTS